LAHFGLKNASNENNFRGLISACSRNKLSQNIDPGGGDGTHLDVELVIATKLAFVLAHKTQVF